jgi:hypothetical protein
MSSPTWHPISTMPEGREVLTRILDDKGERNVQKLKKQGRLFWAGDTYVYYTPTHWAEVSR